MEHRKITNVACYGLGYSNTYKAFERYLLEKGYFKCEQHVFRNNSNEQCYLYPCLDVDAINHFIKLGKADYAVVPLINSDSGVVSFASKMIFNNNYEIADIFTGKIILYMYGLQEIKDLSKIKRIYSNMSALSQCSEFINRYMPFATFIKTDSTTEAAIKMAEKNDVESVCISNDCIEHNDRITRQLFKISNPNNHENIISNGGGSETKFFILKKRTTNIVPKKNIYKMLEGYYIYQSERQGDSRNSVSPAAFRFVEIKEKHKYFDIHGYVYNFKCENLFTSNCTALSEDGDYYHFFYNYDNKHEAQTVNGLVCVDIYLPTFMEKGEMNGKYCGYCNNKSGIIRFKKISKKEFELLISGI